MWRRRVTSKIINKRYEIAAFFMPVLIMVLAFAVNGIYPFGEQQIAVIDMYHQYVPFLSELQSKLQSGDSLLFSWNAGGGINFWCLMSYYCASPLNLLLILFPKAFLMEGITLILLIKIGLAGSFMYIYLSRSQKPDPLVRICREERGGGIISRAEVEDYPGTAGGMKGVAFSCAYGLCAYVLGYYWCIMWMDAVMLLPLCILGLHRIIEGKSSVLYVVSLALIVFSNYYMAIMVCIFILCYYPALYFIRVRGGGAKKCILTTGRAVGFSLLGISMAAVMLLPTYLSMDKTYYFSSEMPTYRQWYSSFFDILRQLLPGYELTYREGLPNLYCGIAAIVFLIVYLATRRVNLREKLINLGVLAFLTVSLNLNILDFIWHGMHFPNQLPYRYSFVFSFLIIGMAYKGFGSLERCRGPVSRRVLLAALVVVTAADCSFGAVKALQEIGSTTREDYFSGAGDIACIAEEKEEAGRMEIYGKHTLNNPALFGYEGVSLFASCADESTSDLMESVGLEAADYKNRYNYVLTDPVTNALLGVRYMVTVDCTLADEDFVPLFRRGDCYVYESRYPLSLGYVACDEVTDWKLDPTDPFLALTDYLEAATGEENAEVFRDAEQVTVKEKKKSTEIKAVSTGKEKYYVFVEPHGAESVDLLINGDYSRSVTEDCGAIIYAGSIAEGDSLSLVINYENEEDKTEDPMWRICTLDKTEWEKAYERLSESLLDVEELTGRGLTGEIDAKQDGRLVLSVPYEDGWTVKVDGEVCEVDREIGGSWISLPVEKGRHSVEMTFMPEGLAAGACLTSASIALLVILRLVARGRSGRRSEELCHSEESDCSKRS